jgi:hypothetical protein
MNTTSTMKIIGVAASFEVRFRKRGFGRFIADIPSRPASIERGPAFLPGRLSE